LSIAIKRTSLSIFYTAKATESCFWLYQVQKSYLVESGIYVCMALRMSTRFLIQKSAPPSCFPAG